LMRLSGSTSTLAQYCREFDERYGCQQGSGLRVARMLMQSRVLIPDLASKDLTKEPLSKFITTAQPGKLRAVGGM